MWKKIAVAGGAAAVILGAGTAALATTGSSTPSSPSPSTSTSAGAHGTTGKDGKKGAELRRSLHAQWVTRDGKSTTKFTTHDEIRGQVTALSATSITVKAADNVSQTYAVNSTTKVHTKADKKGATSSISAVHSGDRVIVVGTGTSTMTATHIVAGLKK
jgi:hypothetical protein